MKKIEAKEQIDYSKKVEDEKEYTVADRKEYFDAIFCLEVSEYFFDPMTAFRNINSLLKKNGILYLSIHLWQSKSYITF